tara:strand:+ start:322 stop:1845 length:1524 start_codon:yes stop_codon:yes gene_type:complete
MPTQLKIVVNDGYVQNAPFTVNFAAPIIIKPNQKIALDKFTAVVNGITTGFSIPPGTNFDLYLSLNSPNYQVVTIQVPPKFYDTIAQLLADLTSYCNNAIAPYLADVLPAFGLTRYYRDLGLKVQCGANTNAFEIQYLTAGETTLTLGADFTLVNMIPNTSGDFYPNPALTGTFGIDQTNPEKFLLQGGGALCEFQFVPASVEDAVFNVLNYKVGLVDDGGFYHGIEQIDTGELYLIDEVNGTRSEIAINTFVADADVFCQLYQNGGAFVLRVLYRNPDENSPNFGQETTLYESSDNNQGAMGIMDYTQQYHFDMGGTREGLDAGTNQTPYLNEKINITLDVPFGTGGVAPPAPATPVFSRTMAMDMTNAGSLRAGFDVPVGLIIFTPANSYWGGYLDTNPINMSVIQSSFDLAIEILDIPLQTYSASSDGRPGQRNNIISYFHPELSTLGTGVYIYDSKAYQWLDIDISYPLNLSSMSFRVYNPETNIDLNAQSMSFNLLINEKEY